MRPTPLLAVHLRPFWVFPPFDCFPLIDWLGTALALVVKFEIGGNQYVCQAANAIEGVLFGEFMKRARHLVKYVDHDSLTLQYIAGTHAFLPPSRPAGNLCLVQRKLTSYQKRFELSIPLKKLDGH